jgi:carbamoyltransferase
LNILGVSCFKPDSSVSLIRDGRILASAQEERFTRKKHDSSFPFNAAKWCLGYGGAVKIDLVVFSDNNPFYKLRALSALSKLKIKSGIIFLSADESFCAAAYYPSGLRDSAILINNKADPGIIFAEARNKKITLLKQRFPYSLGSVYSAYTEYLGFKADSDEYRVMGLAAFGRPEYRKSVISCRNRISKLGIRKRQPGEEFSEQDKNLAASVQAAIEEETLRLTENLHKLTGQDNLCLAGDLALNCLINTKVQKQGLFRRVWVQPAANRSGASLGAALSVWHKESQVSHEADYGKDLMQGCFLGPEFDDAYIENFLNSSNINYRKLDLKKIADTGADLLAQGLVVGWFQGKMEYGPRALGARSILADSRKPGIHDRLNLKIKIRENFRPFAPTVLSEHAGEYFDLELDSPYMLFTASVREGKRKEIAAVCHADNSSRVQTLKRKDNPLYYDLINEFFKKTGCPVIINTSFNTNNEPIVRTPQEAWRCFNSTEIDSLIMGSFLINKRSSR